MTGEVGIEARHGRIVLFGDRSCTWETEADEAEWAGLEEPFALMHKIALHTIVQERNKDAAPRPGRRRTASELYQKIQSVMQRLVDLRWRSAVACRRRDGGQAVKAFRKTWEAPGLAVIVDDTRAQLVLLMRESTRSRWRRHATSSRDFRNQQYAPPDRPPPDMVQIFAAGDADTRQKDKPPPPAGYGTIAITRGREIFRTAGQIIARHTPNVKTTTKNLADLVAFTRALQWAVSHGLARGKPICIRYHSEYAARISTGAWKAKKHKAMAEEARRAWAQLQRVSGGRAWMQHTPAANYYRRAAALAKAGKEGATVHMQVVD